MNKLCYVIEEMQSGCERRLLTTNIIAMGQSAFVIHNYTPFSNYFLFRFIAYCTIHVKMLDFYLIAQMYVGLLLLNTQQV